jgi:outer membrane protein
MAVAFTIAMVTVSAQKFAYVNSQYILSQIPDYKAAQDQINQISIEWQKEIEGKYSEIDQLYKAYKADEVLLTDEMKQKREAEIQQKEQAVKDLQKLHFGVNGDLFKKRQELVKPIQDKVYNAVQELAEKTNLAIIFDASSDNLTILFANPKYDKSDDILRSLGYSTGNSTNNSNKKTYHH